jgi:hypothetical protein
VPRILIAIELPEGENQPRPAMELAARLRDQYGSVSRAAAATGVTRQVFHEWLTGHQVTVKHVIAMTALLAIGGAARLQNAVDFENDTTQ